MRKARFFCENRLGNAIGGFFEFRICVLHEVANREHHLMQEWLVLSEQTPVRDRAADDFTQDVPASFIRGNNTVGDEERGCTGVISNHS